MGFVTHFRSPRDPRWQGTQGRHHAVFYLKNCILLAFILIVIIEGALFFKWWRQGTDMDLKYSPYWFWLRIGIALVPDILYTIATIALVLQKPRLSLRGRTWTFHPAVALSFSLMMFGLYFNACFWNSLIVASNENGFDNLTTWYNLTYVEAGFEATLALCYASMTVYSCIAVHRWRKEKKEVDERYLELGRDQAYVK